MKGDVYLGPSQTLRSFLAVNYSHKELQHGQDPKCTPALNAGLDY